MKGKIKGFAKDRSVFIDGEELSLKPSQKIINHSPDGFNWGYEGSGPAQLALAIILHFTDDKDFAIKNYQDFKREYISKVTMDKNFEIDIELVEDFIEKRSPEKNKFYNMINSSNTLSEQIKKMAYPLGVDVQIVDSMFQKIKGEISTIIANHVRDANNMNVELETLKNRALENMDDYGLNCDYIKDLIEGI